MKFWTTVILTMGISALCILALPIWILGIPGVENEYARGWKMGLLTIGITPVMGVILFLVTILRNKIFSVECGKVFLKITFSLSVAGCFVFIFLIWKSFHIMQMI